MLHSMTTTCFVYGNLLDGSPRKVDMGTNTGVQSGCNYTNLQTDLLAYNTAVADTAAKLKLLKTAEDEFAVVNAGQKATTSRLFEGLTTNTLSEVLRNT